MADGRQQQDWDLFAYSAFWASAAYQKRGTTIRSIHPGYDQKKSKPTKAQAKKNLKKYISSLGGKKEWRGEAG